MSDSWVTVVVDIVKAETPGAVLVVVDGNEEWIPKSQMLNSVEKGDTRVEVIMKEWIAAAKGLSDYCDPYEGEAYDAEHN